MVECVWSSGRSVCYYEYRLHRGFTKLGTSCSITSSEFLSLRHRNHRHRCLVHGIVALFCTQQLTSARCLISSRTQEGRLTHLKHALLLPSRDMTRVHQMTFAHTKDFLAAFEGVACVVGATVFEAGAGLACMEMRMVRDWEGGDQGEDEKEEDESRS